MVFVNIKHTKRLRCWPVKACSHLIRIRSALISHLNHHVRSIATGSIHFDPVRTMNLTGDNLYTRPSFGHLLAYLLLAVTQSCFWRSRPDGFGHCLLPINTTMHLFLVQSNICATSSTTCASIKEYDCHVITSFPVIIHFRFRSNPPTIRGLARSRSNPLRENAYKCGQDWTRSDRDSIAIDVLVRTGL